MRWWLLILLVVVGCVPTGKAFLPFEQNTPDVCMSGNTPQVKEVDVSKFKGQEVNVRFSHFGCGKETCNKETRYLDDVEFLDDKGNAITPEEFKQPTQEVAYKNGKEAFLNAMTKKGIVNYKVYLKPGRVIVEYFDNGPYDDVRVKENIGYILASAAYYLDFADSVEVHHLKGTAPNVKTVMSTMDVLSLMLKTKEELVAEVKLEPLTAEEVLTPFKGCSIGKCNGKVPYTCENARYVKQKECTPTQLCIPATGTCADCVKPACKDGIPHACENGKYVKQNACVSGQECISELGICGECTKPKCESNIPYTCENFKYNKQPSCAAGKICNSFDASCISLPAPWEWYAPVGGSLSLSGDIFIINVPNTKPFNHWSNVDEAPQLRRPAPTGDFTVEGKITVTGVPKEFPGNYFAGLMIFFDKNNIIYFGSEGGTIRSRRSGEDYHAESSLWHTPGTTFTLRVTKKGTSYKFEYSDGKVWTDLSEGWGMYQYNKAPKYVGIMVRTWANRKVEAKFESFKIK